MEINPCTTTNNNIDVAIFFYSFFTVDVFLTSCDETVVKNNKKTVKKHCNINIIISSSTRFNLH